MGIRAEKRSASRMGARQVPGSGATDGIKGDLHLKDLKIECKSTENNSLSVKKDWLDKISREAREVNREPALQVMFVDGYGRPRDGGSWVMIPESMFLEKFG